MDRRQFLGGAAAASVAASLPIEAAGASASHLLDVQETTWEVRPGMVQWITTAGGSYPGTLIRAIEGSTIDVAVRNRTAGAVAVHWHGLVVSPEVDGVPALGTPVVEPLCTRTYRLPITIGGTRWYHAHAGAGLLFGGLSGPFIIDRKNEPGDYDREVVLMLHEFGPSVPRMTSMRDDRPSGAPSLSAPIKTNASSMNASAMSPNMGMRDTRYASYAVNGKALGFGERIRVRRGERVRFRVINASATLTHRLALAAHRFHVIELDGNPVATPRTVEAIELGAGERVDAIVLMDAPGVWVFGSTEASVRENGLGSIVAYDGAKGPPTWRKPSAQPFEYAVFGNAARGSSHVVDRSYDIVLRKSAKSPDAWSLNGRLYPDFEPLDVREAGRYLLRFRNDSMMEHPMHVHGHSFELTSVDGVATSGVMKDTVVVRPQGRIDAFMRASNPYEGRFFLHCHNDQHLEGGMATVLAYRNSKV